jgi:ferritin
MFSVSRRCNTIKHKILQISASADIATHQLKWRRCCHYDATTRWGDPFGLQERYYVVMISEKMNQALNRQATNEFSASHSYLAMACCFREMGLKVFASRFYMQASEERDHALKILKYLEDVGGKASFDAIAKPKSGYASAPAIVEAAVEAEKAVTAQIHELVALADSEKDYATHSFLKWFVDEQVEEVSSMLELHQWVSMAGDKNLFYVEARLAATMKN